MITPIQGHLLVELKGEYEHIEAAEERFGTPKTRGIVVALPEYVATTDQKDDWQAILKLYGIKVGSMVYFGKYEDAMSLKLDNGKPGALIPFKEIGGFENAAK